MKHIIIVGSVRKGNSLYIAEQIALAKGKDCKVVQLSNYQINLCNGCLACDETQKCVFDDGMTTILSDVRNAETIIVVTPSRYALLSGDAKVFIDRLNPTAASEELVGKKFVGIAVGQTDKDDKSIANALKSLEIFAESAGLESLGVFPVYECLGEDAAKSGGEIPALAKKVAKLL